MTFWTIELGAQPMRFRDTDPITVLLTAVDGSGVVHESVQELARRDFIDAEEVESVARAILVKEELGSTGIGDGVAIPHTKHPSVDRIRLVLGVLKEAIDFGSLDCEPVDVFFLIVCPPDRPGDHARLLEYISFSSRCDTFIRFLRQCRSDDELREMLDEWDNCNDFYNGM